MSKQEKHISTRSYLIYFLMLFGALLVLVRVIYIFLIPGPELRELAEKNAYRTREVSGIRGNILSADGELIATSVPVFTLRWDYHVLEARIAGGVLDTMATGLADALNGTKSHYLKELKKAIRTENRYYLIEKEASYEMIKRLKTRAVFNEGRYKSGLITETHTQRQYPYQELAFRTIGLDREGTDNDVGIEGAYSGFLAGEKVSRLEKRISAGMFKPVEMNENVEPKNGYDIVTTLNMLYQDVLENALKKHLMEQKAIEGCAVLMEVNTGNILAIANLSTKTGPLTESYNVALGSSMEPGSTFKLATVLALLEDKKATIADTVKIKDGVKYYYNQRMIDSHIHKGEFVYSLETAFEESSNAAISWFAQKYYGDKPQQYINTLKKFNLAQMQGVEIPGEPSPFIKDKSHKQWSGVSLPWMSIGYELMLTPLQVLGFYNAVANDGVYVKPKFVTEIREGNIVHYKAETEILNNRIAGSEAIADAQYLLEEVVNEGTGRLAFRNSPYNVAGKTGTAQIHSGNEGYGARQYNASFVGYFPAENPKYSCIVVVNRPGAGKYYASSVAVPVFKEIADRVYASDISIHSKDTDTIVKYSAYQYGYLEDLKEILRTMGYRAAKSGTEWASMTIDTEMNTNINESIPPEGRVPNLKGLGLRDAIYMAESAGMSVRANGKGKVIQQQPEPGSQITTNRISVTLQ